MLRCAQHDRLRGNAMARKYNVISADSHLDLSPERWSAHVPAKWREQAPRVVRLESGEDAIVVGDRKPAKIGFTRGMKDPAGYVALNHAYNEYLAEEYCAAAPDRLIAMGVIPTSGIDDAVRELEYCANAGFKGVL